MNIGVIAYALDRAGGGIGRYTRGLIRTLIQNGYHPAVLEAGKSSFIGNTFPLPGASLLPSLMTVGQVEIAWIAKQQHLALIHDPNGVLPLGLAPTKRVATIHDAIPFIYPQTSTFLDRLIYTKWLPVVASRMHAITTVSQHSKSDLIQFLNINPEIISVVPSAYTADYHPMKPEEIAPVLSRLSISPPYILYVGSLEPRKNLVRLLEAFSLCQELIINQHYKLVIVGARNFLKSSPVVNTVEKLSLNQHVHFTGFVPEPDLPALYCGADLFVFPSIYEGFGLPVLEAMACGTPVITSNTSSLPEVAGEAAILVDPYNIQQIAQAMQQVLTNPELAADLRQRGLENAAKYSWERTARETVAVYQRVLENRRS